MNKQGVTLVELLVAGSLLVILLASCGYLFKTSAGFLNRDADGFYHERSLLERVKALPFDQLAAAAPPGVTATRVAADLYLIKAGPLYTLRSKYE